jgi:hypothetical protein
MRWTLAWVPLVFLMILNGVIRESVYGPRMPDLQAHQVSTLTGGAIYFAYLWCVLGRLKIESARSAWQVGMLWLALTVAFEFGFGHFVAGHSWSRLFADYHLFAGRLWLLFLGWVLVAPALVFRMKGRA